MLDCWYCMQNFVFAVVVNLNRFPNLFMISIFFGQKSLVLRDDVMMWCNVSRAPERDEIEVEFGRVTQQSAGHKQSSRWMVPRTQSWFITVQKWHSLYYFAISNCKYESGQKHKVSDAFMNMSLGNWVGICKVSHKVVTISHMSRKHMRLRPKPK